MDEPCLGLFGATGLVGECLLPLLTKAGWQVTAFSRRAIEQVGGGLEWQQPLINLCGGETLHCREMVRRVFATLNRRRRLLKVPLSGFRIVLAAMRLWPCYRHWSAVAEWMNCDLVLDNGDAVRDLEFAAWSLHPVLLVWLRQTSKLSGPQRLRSITSTIPA